MYKKILAAVNEHFNSEVTARYALHLAKHLNAKLYICFIADKGMSQHNRRAAEDAVKRLFNEALDLNIQAESIAEMGDPVAEIGKIVHHENIGIVFASTGREDIKKKVLHRHRSAKPFAQTPMLCCACARCAFREGASQEDTRSAQGKDRPCHGTGRFCHAYGKSIRIKGLCLPYAKTHSKVLPRRNPPHPT